MFEHINGLIARQTFFERIKLIMAPEQFKQMMRRLTRQARRRDSREHRIAGWEYCGKRQRARYARQIARGQLKAENGLVVA